MSVYKKLQEARVRFHKLSLKKTGYNTYSKYYYFELGDFLPSIQQIFYDLGMCGVVSFTADDATLTIVDTDDISSSICINSPMGSAQLTACHNVQNVGAVETYQRRYLWGTAMEIVENDILDSTSGGDEPAKKPAQSVATKQASGETCAAVISAKSKHNSDWL
jgi:hypothetical protein